MIRVVVAAVLALVLGVFVLGLPNDAARLPSGGRVILILGVLLGWGFVAVGSYAWLRRPENRTGALMIVTGLSVLVTGLQFADQPLLYTLGIATDSIILAFFAHLILAFPSGRLEGRAARLAVGAIYVTGLLQVPVAMVSNPGDCPTCPDNLLLIGRSDPIANILGGLQALSAVTGIIGAVVILVRRWRASSGIQRRGLEPVLWLGTAILVLALFQGTAQSGDLAFKKASQIAFFAAFALLPVAFLAGLVRTRFFRTATLGRLIERLSIDPGALRDALRAALDDPTLSVAYWLPDRGAYVDREGRALLPDERVTTQISHRGRRVGALIHDASVCEAPELLSEATAAAALAIENGRLEAELRARLEALRASRARIVEAGDAERRRLGRDLHDGAQQRLVSLMIELQLARERFATQPDFSLQLVDSALDNARAAVDELRDLAAGIHPAVLSQRGLDAGLESLATRASFPVELEYALTERLPLPVETAAYFVAAEALTNVAKYAQATHAVVAVRRDDGAAVIEVRDDGAGGADASAGSGLRGLGDRVGALDGTLEVVSPEGEGTLVRARIPLAAEEGQHG